MRRALLAIGLIGVGLVVGWIIQPLVALVRIDTQTPSGPVYVAEPARLMDLTESVATRGIVFDSVRVELRGFDGGLVTALAVREGEDVDPGDLLATINDRPVVAVAGLIPFWRPLRSGDVGRDVERLQEILMQAGFPIQVDGRFGASTRAALVGFQESYEFEPADGNLLPQDLAPLGSGHRVITSADLGAFLAPGDRLMVLGGGELRLATDLTPNQAAVVAPGDDAVITLTGGQLVDGEVIEIGRPREADAGEGEQAFGSIVYPMIIALDTGSSAVIGENVRVSVTTRAASDAVAVPLIAITTDAEGRPAVRVLSGSGPPELRRVELGVVQSPWVEVITGVRAGEQVVIAEE